MAKISYCLVFTLVLLPLYSVLCQEDAWQSVLSQATQSAGISQDSLDLAKQAFGDGSAQQAAQDAMGEVDGSLADWVQEVDDVTGGSSPPPDVPVDLPDDEEEDNLVETPKNSPTEAPVDAPELSPTISAPQSAPKQKAPTSAPSAAPQAYAPHAPTPQP